MNPFETDLHNALLKKQMVASADLERASQESTRTNIALPQYLVENNLIDEEKLLQLISEILHIPIVRLAQASVDSEAIKAVPVRFAWYYEFLPLKKEGRSLTIAVNLPLSIRVQDELRLNLGFEISMVLAKKEKIVQLLKVNYGLGAETVDQMITQEAEKETGDGGQARAGLHDIAIQDIEKKAEDASVIKLVNQIILEAYKRRATDVHIEPFRGKMRLRYRIDGILYDQTMPEHLNRFLGTILSRIKIMSNLDIVERRIPQDGRVVVKTQEQVLDLRVSFIPTPHGESVVIRILPTKTFFSLEKLGLAQENYVILESLIKKPNGMVFVTGPTGSGKTTTLYACIKRMNSTEKKIVTLEDPIEYEMENTTQIQINPEVGLTFAKGLRSVLRHDPDIIMLGEVRDLETAEIAIRVSLTGHLVLSTLHTNDAATGITRLIDIGIEPYLVSSSVDAFIGQRLIRAICPHCKKEDVQASDHIKNDIVQSLQMHDPSEVRIYKGIGCERCNFTGFYGRTAIYEILVINESLRKLITQKASASVLQRQAISDGMRTMLQDGWLKVIEGTTTPEEVLNVCQESKLEVSPAPPDEVEVDEPKEYMKTTFAAAPHVHDEKDRRIYARIPKRIGIKFKIVEKGEGEIVALDRQPGQHAADITSLFEDVAAQKVNDVVYRDVFTTTVNMSAGGLAFESRYLLPVNSILELVIELEPHQKPVTCLAKVVRVEKELPRCFFIAVCFLDISGVDRKQISDFVEAECSKLNKLDVPSKAWKEA